MVTVKSPIPKVDYKGLTKEERTLLLDIFDNQSEVSDVYLEKTKHNILDMQENVKGVDMASEIITHQRAYHYKMSAFVEEQMTELMKLEEE